jgi:hypothetical protein
MFFADKKGVFRPDRQAEKDLIDTFGRIDVSSLDSVQKELSIRGEGSYSHLLPRVVVDKNGHTTIFME